jgi:hypothetical protein
VSEAKQTEEGLAQEVLRRFLILTDPVSGLDYLYKNLWWNPQIRIVGYIFSENLRTKISCKICCLKKICARMFLRKFCEFKPLFYIRISWSLKQCPLLWTYLDQHRPIITSDAYTLCVLWDHNWQL